VRGFVPAKADHTCHPGGQQAGSERLLRSPTPGQVGYKGEGGEQLRQPDIWLVGAFSQRSALP
jgi:hypothetical protein